jgi:hypothetical protein
VLDDRGRPARPWLTVILDDYSRAVAGYALSLHAPSSIQTALALRQAVWRKGDAHWSVCGIPEMFHSDHGSDFTSHHLELLARVAGEYPSFRLVMGARVEHLIEEGGVVTGVRYRGQGGWHTVRAVLTVGADGRFSRVRELAGLASTRSAYPMDFLWFRLPTSPLDADSVGGVYVGDGGCAYLRNRGQQWEVGYWLPFGTWWPDGEIGDAGACADEAAEGLRLWSTLQPLVE